MAGSNVQLLFHNHTTRKGRCPLIPRIRRLRFSRLNRRLRGIFLQHSGRRSNPLLTDFRRSVHQVDQKYCRSSRKNDQQQHVWI